MSVAFESSSRGSEEPFAVVYRFMARLVMGELDHDVRDALGRPQIRALFTRCDPQVPDALDPWTAARRAAADEAYAAAFLLPGGASPRACAWLADGSDDRLDRFTAGVTAQMRRLGLERRSDDRAGRLPLDHLGLLLEIAAVGLERADASTPAWIDGHVSRWAGRWGRALAGCSGHPVYRALGVLSESLFGDEPLPRS